MNIAITGASCHFPQSKTLAEYWQNLQAGKECVHFFTEEELQAAGQQPQAVRRVLIPKPGKLKGEKTLWDTDAKRLGGVTGTARESQPISIKIQLNIAPID